VLPSKEASEPLELTGALEVVPPGYPAREIKVASQYVDAPPPETQEKIKRYHELRIKINELIGEERNEYEELRQFMKEAQPIGGPPEPGSLEARTKAFLEANLP